MPHRDSIRSENVTAEEIRQKLAATIGDYVITEEQPGTFLIEVKPEIEERLGLALIERAFKLLAKEE